METFKFSAGQRTVRVSVICARERGRWYEMCECRCDGSGRRRYWTPETNVKTGDDTWRNHSGMLHYTLSHRKQHVATSCIIHCVTETTCCYILYYTLCHRKKHVAASCIIHWVTETYMLLHLVLYTESQKRTCCYILYYTL